MVLEDCVRQVGDEPFEITDMKAFGSELAKLLCNFYHIKHVPEISLLSEEEYLKKYPYTGQLECSMYDPLFDTVVIKDKDKNNPLVYGEEIAHFIREKTRPDYVKGFITFGNRTENEFFGFLGQMATYHLLQQKETFKGHISKYMNTSEFFSIFHKDGRQIYKEAMLHLSQLRPRLDKQIENLRRKANTLNIKLKIIRFLPEVLRQSLNFKDLCSSRSKIYHKLHKLHNQSDKYYDAFINAQELESCIDHAEGYYVAEQSYSHVQNDPHLFYRPNEEIRKMYFEPVIKSAVEDS